VTAATWRFVDPPVPGSVAGLLTKVGTGLLIGVCVTLTAYAVIWHIRRIRISWRARLEA
jgi:hypothetical protein